MSNPPVPRHGRLKPHGPGAAIAQLFLVLIVVLLISSTSVAGAAVWSLAHQVKKGVHLETLPGHTAVAPPQIGAIGGAVNLLLVGSDSRADQGKSFSDRADQDASSGLGNNDVTILLHIAANHQSAMLVSFPRDTVVPIPSCPASNGGRYPIRAGQMLNTSLSYGGLDCPVLTIEQLTGTNIPYAAAISFDGVAAMSKAVGGVTVCVATPIDDVETGLKLSAGEHSLEGGAALAFLRTRHGIADGSDLGRISSQEVFLSSLVRQVKSGGVLSNPLQLYGLADAAVKHMTLSDTLEAPATLISMAVALKDIPLSNVVMLQYPTVVDPTNVNRVVPNIAADQAVNAALLSNESVRLSGTTGRGSEVAPSKPTPKPTGTSTNSPSPAPTTPASPSIVLPAIVTGQTAAQTTCAKGNAR
jgi:LCP family protein required for cell wall assembly